MCAYYARYGVEIKNFVLPCLLVHILLLGAKHGNTNLVICTTPCTLNFPNETSDISRCSQLQNTAINADEALVLMNF